MSADRLVIDFSPEAIREHFLAFDPTDEIATFAVEADDDTLVEIAEIALSNDVLWSAFHEALEEAVKRIKDAESFCARCGDYAPNEMGHSLGKHRVCAECNIDHDDYCLDCLDRDSFTVVWDGYGYNVEGGKICQRCYLRRQGVYVWGY